MTSDNTVATIAVRITIIVYRLRSHAAMTMGSIKTYEE